MSTKIYTGFRFKTSNLREIHEHFLEWRKRIDTLTREAKHRYLAKHAVENIDNAIAYGKPVPKNPLLEVDLEMNDAQAEIKKTGQRNVSVDFDFEVSVMPWGRKVYGIIFCEQSAWIDEFMSQPWVEEYGYWNNTDRPDHLTARQWERRRKTWNAILKQDPWDRPSGCGFTADCKAPDRFSDNDAVLAACPSKENRVARTARSVVLGRAYKTLMEPLSEEERKQRCFSMLFDAERLLKTEEWQAKVAEEELRLAELLPEMTITILLGWDPEERKKSG